MRNCFGFEDDDSGKHILGEQCFALPGNTTGILQYLKRHHKMYYEAIKATKSTRNVFLLGRKNIQYIKKAS